MIRLASILVAISAPMVSCWSRIASAPTPVITTVGYHADGQPCIDEIVSGSSAREAVFDGVGMSRLPPVAKPRVQAQAFYRCPPGDKFADDAVAPHRGIAFGPGAFALPPRAQHRKSRQKRESEAGRPTRPAPQ